MKKNSSTTTQHSSTDPRHVLIYEPQSGGHRAEFIRYLLDQLASKEGGDGTLYTFAVAEELLEANSDLQVLAWENNAVSIVSITKSESAGLRPWRLCCNVCEQIKPTHLMLMDLTPLELSLCFFRPSCRFSAILFVQYPELLRKTLKQCVKFVIKDFKTRLLLKNPMLHRVFLLNGEYSCDYLNQRFNINRYLPIPDPVPPGNPSPTFDLRKQYDIAADKKLFLFFGSMSARKGTDVLLEALLHISAETCRKTAFLFCGVPEPDYSAHYDERCAESKKRSFDLTLIRDVRHFESSEMKAAFLQADWILMPYLRSDYSSGILAHAAEAATPVIAPSSGLQGRLVKKYELGCCSDINAKALAETIDKAYSLNHTFNEEKRMDFVQQSNRIDFAELILKTVRSNEEN